MSLSEELTFKGDDNLHRDIRAVSRGLISNAADLSYLADEVGLEKLPEKTGSIIWKMRPSLVPDIKIPGTVKEGFVGALKEKYPKATKVIESINKSRLDNPSGHAEDFLHNKYEELREKKLSDSEAQNMMEDFLEQLGYHADDFVPAGMFTSVQPTLSAISGEPFKSVEELQNERTKQKNQEGHWVDNAEGVRTYVGVHKKNLPVTYSKRRLQPSESNVITL